MKLKIGQVVAASVVAGLLGTGGMALAGAQEDPSTTSTTEAESETTPTTTADDSTTTPEVKDEDCPERGGPGGPAPDSSRSGSDSSTSTDAGNL